MPARGVIPLARAEHPHELGDNLITAALPDSRARRHGARILGDLEMPLAEGCDLRKVGDAQDLPAARKIA